MKMHGRVEIFLIGVMLIILIVGVISVKDTSHIRLEIGWLKLDIVTTDTPEKLAISVALPH